MTEQKNNDNGGNRGRAEEDAGGFPVHSQVRRIKQESESMIDDGTRLEQDFRPVLRNARRQRSRSPLGISRRTISVGD